MYHSYFLSSALKARPFVLNTEDIAVGTALDMVENTILPALPVLVTAGLKLLQEKERTDYTSSFHSVAQSYVQEKSMQTI